jgi:hypothetical protein
MHLRLVSPRPCDQYHRRGLRGPAEEISKYLQQLEIATIPVWMPIARFNSCAGRERLEYSYGKDLPTLLYVVSCGAALRADSNIIPKYHARFRLPRDCAILVCCDLLTPCPHRRRPRALCLDRLFRLVSLPILAVSLFPTVLASFRNPS